MPVRVLIADDAPDLRLLLRITLGGAGFDVVGEAPDAVSTLRALDELAPDIVVLDLKLPGAGDDYATVSEVRAAAPQAGLLVFSGFPDPAAAEQAIAAGADRFVLKTDAIDELPNAVAELAVALGLSAT